MASQGQGPITSIDDGEKSTTSAPDSALDAASSEVDLNEEYDHKQLLQTVIGDLMSQKIKRSHENLVSALSEYDICLLYTSPSPRDS